MNLKQSKVGRLKSKAVLCLLAAVLCLPFSGIAQNALGKHPADKILPTLFSGTNGAVNANSIIQGLNQYGTMSGTNPIVFGTGSGTSGALTNDETRAVTLQNSLTISNNGNAGAIKMFDAIGGSVSLSNIGNTISFSGGIVADSFIGDGESMTGVATTAQLLGATNAATLPSSINATNGLVAGLAAGSVPVNEQALRGFLRFSSTNTAFVDGAATNAITVVSNATGWASVTFSGAGAVARLFDGTYYPTANAFVYTNGATKGFWFSGSTLGSYPIVTNATYPDSTFQNGDEAAGILLDVGQFPTFNDALWVDNGLDQNPITVVSTEGALTYTPTYASFNGKHVGDGSALTGIPTPSGIITNNWQSSAGQIHITNKVTVNGTEISGGDIRYNFANPYTNTFILSSNVFKFAGENSLYGAYKFFWGSQAQSYADWGGDAGSYGLLIRTVNGIGMEVPSDNGVIRLTDDHRIDGLVKLAGQSISGLVFPSNNYSGMLAFQAPVTNGAGDYIPSYAGIRAKNATGVSVFTVVGESWSTSELWFYYLIPPQLPNANGGFRSVGDTNWFGIGKTNAFYVKGLTVVSNYINQWPTAPHIPGDFQFVNSNGYPYVLLSTNGGGGGAATWTATNKVSW